MIWKLVLPAINSQLRIFILFLSVMLLNAGSVAIAIATNTFVF
jgi:hypothetical protein